MHPFSTLWKQKTERFSDVFRGLRKDALGANGLIGDLPFDVLGLIESAVKLFTNSLTFINSSIVACIIGYEN